MLSKVIIGALDKQRWLDTAATALDGVASAAFDQLGPVSKKFEDLLHGTPVGHPIHPILVVVPIGAWTVAAVFDLVGMEEGADYALNIGLVGAVGAAISGIADWRYTQGTTRRVGTAHAMINTAATTLSAISAYQRWQGNRTSAKVFSSLGYACVMAGGYLGGDLSYNLGIVVNRNAWLMGSSKFVPVLPLVDLEENQPTRATADGEDVVLVRHGDQVHALANACAHLGGPLSDGKVDGKSITCPWHGSTFSLEDGQVMCGPSPYNQPCYTARVQNGIVEVKLSGEYGEREPFYRITTATETAYSANE